jgi:hypothetical protein
MPLVLVSPAQGNVAPAGQGNSFVTLVITAASVEFAPFSTVKLHVTKVPGATGP